MATEGHFHTKLTSLMQSKTRGEVTSQVDSFIGPEQAEKTRQTQGLAVNADVTQCMQEQQRRFPSRAKILKQNGIRDPIKSNQTKIPSEAQDRPDLSFQPGLNGTTEGSCSKTKLTGTKQINQSTYLLKMRSRGLLWVQQTTGLPPGCRARVWNARSPRKRLSEFSLADLEIESFVLWARLKTHILLSSRHNSKLESCLALVLPPSVVRREMSDVCRSALLSASETMEAEVATHSTPSTRHR